MGCNQTKSDDVRRDAERRRIQQQRAQQQQQQQQPNQSSQRNANQSPNQAQSSQQGQKSSRSASTPIASPNAKTANTFDDDNAGVHVGASYTDSRMEEHDYFKDIIDKAESRFIDVNDADGHARERDNSNHSHHAGAAGGSAGTSARASLVLAANPVGAALDVAYSLTKPSMPVPSDRPRNVAAVLAAPPLATDAQRAQMHDWCTSLSDAMRSVSIEDRGQLVVPWRTDVE